MDVHLWEQGGIYTAPLHPLLICGEAGVLPSAGVNHQEMEQLVLSTLLPLHTVQHLSHQIALLCCSILSIRVGI